MPAKIAIETAAVLQCGRCGYRYRNMGTESVDCPECGYDKPAGVHIWGGAVEYALADRRKGYALEDIRFGKLAQWAGLISVNEYQEALSIQREMLGKLGSIPCLAEVMMKRGFMNKRQVEAVLRARIDGWHHPSDDDFGKMALEKGLITQPQYEAARQAQLKIHAEGGEAPPLPLALYEKRFMQDKEIAALIMAQDQKRAGLAALIRSAASRSKSNILPMIIGEKGAPRKARIIGALVGIAVIAVLVWRISGGFAAPLVTTYCASCEIRHNAPINSAWPIPCRSCGKTTVYPMAVCTQCGNQFHVERPGSPGIRCPECGSSQYLMMTGDVDPQQYRKEAPGDRRPAPGREGGRP